MLSYFFGLIFVAVISQVHSLNVRPCGKLPGPIYSTTAVYDGSSDIIYILGGYDGRYYYSDILKYDINSQSVEFVGFLERPVSKGVAIIDKNGDIYYIGGGLAQYGPYKLNYIHKFSIKDSKASILRTLETHYWPEASSAVKIDDSIYIIGDYGRTSENVFRYHIPTNAFGNVTKIPGGLTGTSVAYNGKHIYALGGYDRNYKPTDAVIKFDPATNEIKVLNATLPQTRGNANALVVGDTAYLVGGKGNQKINTAILFNLTDESMTETIVNSTFPLPSRAGAVYVEKKNEIFIFGGLSSTGGIATTDIFCLDFKN